jgi:hypothetical protein
MAYLALAGEYLRRHTPPVTAQTSEDEMAETATSDATHY